MRNSATASRRRTLVRSRAMVTMRSGVLMIAIMTACAPADDPSGGSESSESTSSTTTSTGPGDSTTETTESTESSSGGDSSSTGEPPPASPCELAEITQGIVGRTDVRTCDTEGDCVDPESGVEVWLYDENPQIGGGDFEPGMLDPDIPRLDMTTSGADGRFEFALGASSYHVCTPEGADMVLCSAPMIVVGADPLHVARYEHGNGSSWSTSSCLE